MTNVLAQPSPEQYADPEAYRFAQSVYGLLTGQADWGTPIANTSFDDDSVYAHTIRNLGDGGALNILNKAGASLLTANEAGVSVGVLALTTLSVSGNATVGGTLGVTGAITGASTVQGTRLISTVAVGTAPLTVTSTTVVPNLNVSQLGGHPLADFALLAGAAFTGNVSVSTNALNVDAAANKVRINSASVTGWDLTVGTGGILAEGASRFQGALTVSTGGLSVLAGGATITGTVAVTGAFSASLSSLFSAGLTVQGGLTVQTGGLGVSASGIVVSAGGLDVTGTTTIRSATTITTGGLTVSAGGIDNTGGTLTTDYVSFVGSTYLFDIVSGGTQTQTTVGAAGGASALPATPQGYLKFKVGSNTRVIPFYQA